MKAYLRIVLFVFGASLGLGIALTGCQHSSAIVISAQTVKGVGQLAEATVATSARLYQSGTITSAQAKAINEFYDSKFMPAFRTAESGVEAGTAPAPDNLVQLAKDLSSLLSSFQNKTP